MDLAIKIAKFVLFAALAFFLIVLGVAVQDAKNTLRKAELDIKDVTDKAGVELITLNASTSAISDQTVKTLKQVGGTATQAKNTIASLKPSIDQLQVVLKEGYSVEHDARLSLDNVNKAAIAERQYFEKSLPDLMDAIKIDVADAGDTITAAKVLVADPNLKRILQQSADIETTGNHMLVTADAVETKATKDYLHPSTNPMVRTWKAVEPFLIPLAEIGGAVVAH